MKLRDWLHANRVKKIDFAAKIGVSPSRVSQLCEHELPWPSRELALRIAEATDGAVTINDFMEVVSSTDNLA